MVSVSVNVALLVHHALSQSAPSIVGITVSAMVGSVSVIQDIQEVIVASIVHPPPQEMVKQRKFVL
jgi:hypothetical protein